METLLAIVVGGLYGMSFYLMLRRSMVKLIFGLILFSQAANLLIFTSAGLTRGRAPILPEIAAESASPMADPLPQALVLTAIVIGFGLLAFALALLYRVHDSLRTDDLDQMRRSDES